MPKLFFGLAGHHHWHYTRGPKPPHWLALWYARCWSSPSLELVIDFYDWLKAKALCRDPEWVIEGRERQAAEAAKASAPAQSGESVQTDAGALDAPHGSQSGGSASSMADARELRAHKRFLTYAGLVGTMLTWAVFSWCALGGVACPAARAVADACASAGRLVSQVHLHLCAPAPCRMRRFTS